MSRSSYAYRSIRDESELLELIKEKALVRRRWGYRRLHVLLRREGHKVNAKHAYRLGASGPAQEEETPSFGARP